MVQTTRTCSIQNRRCCLYYIRVASGNRLGRKCKFLAAYRKPCPRSRQCVSADSPSGKTCRFPGVYRTRCLRKQPASAGNPSGKRCKFLAVYRTHCFHISVFGGAPSNLTDNYSNFLLVGHRLHSHTFSLEQI